MINLYLNIIKALNDNAAKFTEIGLEPIRTIDLYNGQPDNPAAFEFVSPAVFVDYRIEWERGGSGVKQGVVSVDTHIITDPVPGTESWSNRSTDGLRRLMYYTLIGQILESVRSDEVGKLYATAEAPAATDFFDYHITSFDAQIVRNKASLRHIDDIKLLINGQSDKG